jgi:4-amino-4-deoxy-L-arabinose transferase-like glycosyltransferase
VALMRLFRLLIFSVVALYCLYFFGLSRCGLLGPDEPRYAAIGLQMAHSGDYVMPVLWGEAWFEKPPLLYWMTAAGSRLGLDGDLAPRLPVALLSVTFLVFFFAMLRREFGARTALLAAAILATSAGWLGYSHIAVTDLPLSVTFAAGMLLLLRPDVSWRRAALSGVLFGLAVLAKGLVPFVLMLPALWFLRRNIRAIAVMLSVAVAIALPWYAAMYARAGGVFIDDFIWKHHFERFASDALQHVQPWWYYVPVLLAGLVPWTPLAALLRRQTFTDSRARFLLAWFLWGLVFFSASRNKLPGYVLPLLPAAAALFGIALDATRRAWTVLATCALLVYLFPVAEGVLPVALITGIRRAGIQFLWAPLLPVIALVISAAVLELRNHRVAATMLVSAGVVIATTHFIWTSFPVLDRTVSARQVWHKNSSKSGQPCVASSGLTFRYGLNYYFGFEVPDCTGASGELPLPAGGAAFFSSAWISGGGANVESGTSALYFMSESSTSISWPAAFSVVLYGSSTPSTGR